MPDPSAQHYILFVTAEAVCWLAGLALGAAFLTGRLAPRAALTPWKVSLEGFVACVLLVILGAILMPYVPPALDDSLLGPAAYDTGWWTAVQGAAFQLGLLGGALLGALLVRFSYRADVVSSEPPPLDPAPPTRRPILAGLVTFLISLPLIGGIGFVWKWLLELFGHHVAEQEMVDLFRNADDPGLLVFMTLLAAVIAPVTEELIFRAGLFRYLRTRIPRWLAVPVPALIFSSLHGNLAAFVPLFALGVFFTIAYERTGRIAVPMIAHSLFNLHTIVLVMAGFAD